jgi:hypothetical protein
MQFRGENSVKMKVRWTIVYSSYFFYELAPLVCYHLGINSETMILRAH